MVPTARLLLVDDDEAACRLLAEVLEREAYEVVSALSVEEALAAIGQSGPFDAILTDLRMPGSSGLDLLRAVRERDPSALVLVLTAFGDAAAAGEAIRAGAYDFISKPYDIAALRETLGRALGRRRMATVGRRQAGEPSARVDLSRQTSEPALVGHSPAIIQVMKTLARVAPSQASVLVMGETGTGKELVARTIHHFSDRADRRFVAVNCSALAEGMLESELFGHVKGAFTGASASRPGLFREADRGTLFLDEIGDISPGTPVAAAPRTAGARDRSRGRGDARQGRRARACGHASRSPGAGARGRFREDLYYRLNVVTLVLPPLRERRQDIPLLLDHFLRSLAVRHGRGPVAVDTEAQRRLLGYDWPGNIRELQNVLERAMLLAEQDVIGPEHLPAEVPPCRTPGCGQSPETRVRRGPCAPSRSSSGSTSSAS